MKHRTNAIVEASIKTKAVNIELKITSMKLMIPLILLELAHTCASKEALFQLIIQVPY